MSTTISDSVAFPAKAEDESAIAQELDDLRSEHGDDIIFYDISTLYHEKTNKQCDAKYKIWKSHCEVHKHANPTLNGKWVDIDNLRKCAKFIRVCISANGHVSNSGASDISDAIEAIVEKYAVEARPIESEFEGEHSETWCGPDDGIAEALDIGDKLVASSSLLTKEQLDDIYHRCLVEQL